jgi:hypothetical protein
VPDKIRNSFSCNHYLNWTRAPAPAPSTSTCTSPEPELTPTTQEVKQLLLPAPTQEKQHYRRRRTCLFNLATMTYFDSALFWLFRFCTSNKRSYNVCNLWHSSWLSSIRILKRKRKKMVKFWDAAYNASVRITEEALEGPLPVDLTLFTYLTHNILW